MESSETWKEVHRAVVCCICGKRGPGVVGDERDARFVAANAGWWIRNIHTRMSIPKLAGNCSAQMGLAGQFGGARHHIIFDEHNDFDHRAACHGCVAFIRSDTEPKKEQP